MYYIKSNVNWQQKPSLADFKENYGFDASTIDALKLMKLKQELYKSDTPNPSAQNPEYKNSLPHNWLIMIHLSLKKKGKSKAIHRRISKKQYKRNYKWEYLHQKIPSTKNISMKIKFLTSCSAVLFLLNACSKRGQYKVIDNLEKTLQTHPKMYHNTRAKWNYVSKSKAISRCFCQQRIFRICAHNSKEVTDLNEVVVGLWGTQYYYREQELNQSLKLRLMWWVQRRSNVPEDPTLLK
jgi:hypothetical protein